MADLVYKRNEEYVPPEADEKGWPIVMPKRIVAASVLWRGRLYTGERHGILIQQIVEDYVVDVDKCLDADGERVYVKLDEQGFLCDNGQHVGRAPAEQIAWEAGQIPEDFDKCVLTSEDMW